MTNTLTIYEQLSEQNKLEHSSLQEQIAHMKSLLQETKIFEKKIEESNAVLNQKNSEIVTAVSEISAMREKEKESECISKANNERILELEGKVVELASEIEKKNKCISIKDEHLVEAEELLKELNSVKKELKSRLDSLAVHFSNKDGELKILRKEFDKYKKEHNDEITQNKVNELENKMKCQSSGMKKLTEEILKLDTQLKLSIDQKNKLEQEKLEILKQEDSKLKKLTTDLNEEKYNNNELGMTIENLRKNVQKLETEKMLKESLEIEYKQLQGELLAEKEIQKKLNIHIKGLERSKKVTEERCLSAEKVLKTISEENLSINKENQKINLSKQEIEAVLQHSRPSSRRQALSSVDPNTSAMLMNSYTQNNSNCCTHLAELEQIKLERDAALSKLASTRSSLASTAEKLSQSNRRKKQVEKAICQQLSKTHEVLKKTKTNLENVGGDSN